MKFRFAVLSLLLCLAFFAFSAGAQATFTVLTGTLTAVNIIEGTVNCQIGVPTGNPFLPCSVGGKGTIRGRSVPALLVLSDPRYNAEVEITANINFDRNNLGQMWGTFVSHLGDGSVVEGTYNGTVNLSTLAYELRGEGHGNGGFVDGQQSKYDFSCAGGVFPNIPPAQVVVRMLTPGGKL